MEPALLEVELSFFPLMWILYLVTPSISINGSSERHKGGKHKFKLAPGRYEISAWYPYLFSSQTSKASIVLDLASGGTYKIRYRPAWLVFLDGSLKLVGAPTLPQATARALPPS